MGRRSAEKGICVQTVIPGAEIVSGIDGEGDVISEYSHNTDENGLSAFCAYGKDLIVKKALPQFCFFVPESKLIESFSVHFYPPVHRNTDHNSL
jgi:hypothetical protein